MTDTITAPGAGALLAFDLVTLPDGTTNVLVARNKAGFGIDGIYADVTDANGLPTRPRAPVPDTAVVAGSIDPTTVGSFFAVAPNGNGTVVLKIGTLGTAFPGGTVVVFEKVGVPGAAAIGTNVYPRGAANSGRVKSTSVGGEFIFAAEAGVTVQARVSVAGTGAALAVSAQLAAPAALQPVVPVNVGQTTRLWNEAASQYLATGAADAFSAALACSEVKIRAIGAALWYTRVAAGVTGVVATAGSGSDRLAADESDTIQCVPGDVIHFIQDVVAGHILLKPVA